MKRIRPYRVEDRNACLELFKSNIPKFFLPEEVQGFEEYLDKHVTTNYWVLEIDGEVIACGGIGVKPPEGRLHYGMVANKWHKKGIGSELLKFRLAKLVENPEVKVIGLDTSQHNPKFFSRFGFEEVSVKENAYGVGLHRHDMNWNLPVDSGDREKLRNMLAARSL
jgi:N-acetylglutamate synthase-like GNAT family acetyltransferase